ncbi:hypothetical protein QWZ13_07345 [Reinekea marina]|uniref:hypothetical protein n=1 Tax=Reinekea marina TaxID=1310421 RepID=UPI0025B306BF|nr:hypothetical protein [Reinekea marina]MDN3648728.1 hypothetical protein [Reinekea marina]
MTCMGCSSCSYKRSTPLSRSGLNNEVVVHQANLFFLLLNIALVGQNFKSNLKYLCVKSNSYVHLTEEC